MQTYKAPVRDMQFVLNEVLRMEEQLGDIPEFSEVNAELVDGVLEQAARLFEEVVHPTNMTGHEQGCERRPDGTVRVPDGFREAYHALVDAGWLTLSAPTEYGGQGLPETLNFFVGEMSTSANTALSLYPVLTHGACLAMESHLAEELRHKYLPNMVSGRWSGTMCLTEAHAGTDLGMIRTRAVPRPDGTYGITGTKIFITCGEHDLTDNIIHLVLARLPDAPEGVRGISLFLVPKYLVDESGEGANGAGNGAANGGGAPGARNHAHCVSVETKMGIKGAPACVMSFEDATGWLVGEPHQGLACMFTMMNHERLAVGMQGLGIAEKAYQSAVVYARERLQGRSLAGPQRPDLPADPIIFHPDVRRMLQTTRAWNEGSRAFAGWIGLEIDRAHHHPDPETRHKAGQRIALLTPVVKAFLSDLGYENATRCQQVFGGAGYIAETGMEQLVRDARIAQIYEGTNGVQANDLVGRKLFVNGGQIMRELGEDLRAFIAERKDNPELAEYLEPFAAALARLEAVTEWLLERAADNREELGAAAVDYLRLTGLVCLGYMWVAMAETALERAPSDNSGFYSAKLATARYFMGRLLLPETAAAEAAIRSGADTLMALAEEAY